MLFHDLEKYQVLSAFNSDYFKRLILKVCHCCVHNVKGGSVKYIPARRM